MRFDETPNGRKFFQSDFPKLVEGIKGLVEETKRANDLKERELELKEKELRLKYPSASFD